jgi:hypothetical protein
MEAKPGASAEPWKAGAKMVVDNVDPNRRTVGIRI